MSQYMSSTNDLLRLRTRRGMFLPCNGDLYAAVACYVAGAMAANDGLMPGFDLFVHHELGTNFVVAAEVELLRPMGEEVMRQLVQGGGTKSQNLEAIDLLLDMVEAYQVSADTGLLSEKLKQAAEQKAAR